MENNQDFNKELDPMMDEGLEVQQDERDIIDVAQDIISKYGMYLVVSLVAVTVVIVWSYYSGEQAKEELDKSSVALSRVMPLYTSGDFEKALNGTDSVTYNNGKMQGLIEIADAFAGSENGEMAAMYAGNSYIAIDKCSEAKRFFDLALKSDSKVVLMGSNAGLAVCLEKESKFDEAAQSYEKASKLAVQKNTKYRYMYFAAICYEKVKNNDKAIEICKEIASDDFNSEFTNYAKATVVRLGMKIE